MSEPPPKKSARPTVATEDGPRGGKSPDHQPEVILTQCPSGGKHGPILGLSSSASYLTSDHYRQLELPSSIAHTTKDGATRYSCVRPHPRRTLHLTVEDTLQAVLKGDHPDPLASEFPEVWMPGGWYDDPQWLADNPGATNAIHELCRHWRDDAKFDDLPKWARNYKTGLSDEDFANVLIALVKKGWLVKRNGRVELPIEHCPILKFKQLWEAHQNVSAE